MKLLFSFFVLSPLLMFGMDSEKIEKIRPIQFFSNSKFAISNWTDKPMMLCYWFGNNNKTNNSFCRDIRKNSGITITTDSALDYPKPLSLLIKIEVTGYFIKKIFIVDAPGRYFICSKEGNLELKKVGFLTFKTVAK